MRTTLEQVGRTALVIAESNANDELVRLLRQHEVGGEGPELCRECAVVQTRLHTCQRNSVAGWAP